MELKTTKNNLENRMPLKRVIRDKITDKIKEDRATKITRDIESINNNVDNGNEIWEVKRKIESKDDILKDYARYYKELLKTRTAENMKEEKTERKVEKKLQETITD